MHLTIIVLWESSENRKYLYARDTSDIDVFPLSHPCLPKAYMLTNNDVFITKLGYSASWLKKKYFVRELILCGLQLSKASKSFSLPIVYLTECIAFVYSAHLVSLVRSYSCLNALMLSCLWPYDYCVAICQDDSYLESYISTIGVDFVSEFC